MPSFPDGRHSGTVVPLDRANVDTDAIFPKQYGRSTARSGYGPVLFDSWPLLGQDIDWIGATLAQRERIAAFEAARLARQPWLDKILEPGSPP